MACKTIRVFLPNLKLFGSMKTELWAEEVGQFSIMLYGKMGWYQHGCHKKMDKYFLDFEQIELLLLSVYQPETFRDTSHGVIYIV